MTGRRSNNRGKLCVREKKGEGAETRTGCPSCLNWEFDKRPKTFTGGSTRPQVEFFESGRQQATREDRWTLVEFRYREVKENVENNE